MSAPPADLLEAGLAKIDDDLAFVMGCLREVLVELGEGQSGAFRALDATPARPPTTRRRRPSFPPGSGRCTPRRSSCSTSSRKTSPRRCAARGKRRPGPASEPGLWGANLQRLRAAGLSAEEIAAGLAQVIVEPVLTAHPTEAKRPTALEQHRRLFQLLHAREDPRHTPLELADGREEIKVTLERLWRTGEILLRKPEVAAERRNLMYYFREVFPRALPELDRRLRQAWARRRVRSRAARRRPRAAAPAVRHLGRRRPRRPPARHRAKPRAKRWPNCARAACMSSAASSTISPAACACRTTSRVRPRRSPRTCRG